jgi:glycosyltransferase involved in cell wall biosynthesis
MARRGHDIMFPPKEDGRPYLPWLATCDVVHVYRRSDAETRRALAELLRRGIPITYDNDDDYTAIPKGTSSYRIEGGFRGQQTFAQSVNVARTARCFTTTTEVLAEKYRHAGVERVAVIGNYLAPSASRMRTPHDGVVIGWIAGEEHQVDANRLRIADVLRRIVATHDNVRVECIGVNLGLTERYTHNRLVAFEELPNRIGGFDIGIAPLADVPMNRARSDIKVKEYAASGVPWLASPMGPYAGLGEEEGGQLVPDDGWFDALDRLVTSPRERHRLGRKGQAWAKTQTIEAAADLWEQTFAAVAGRALDLRPGAGQSASIRLRVRQSGLRIKPRGG